MAGRLTVVVHFKDLSSDDELRESIEKRCENLARDFHEISHCEIRLEEDGAGFVAHGHVTGKGTDVATQAGASELGPAVDRVLDKVERQLRRVHDKRIFSQRRDAQRDPPKRKIR
jgi:ribosomal subunit interface protein